MTAALSEVVRLVIAAAVAAERERCARIADAHARDDDEASETACAIADEIRAEQE